MTASTLDEVQQMSVSAFTSADIGKILALEPDLVLTFSDLQAEIAADILRSGVTVIGYNQRHIAGILAIVRQLGALVDQRQHAEDLAGQLERRLTTVAAATRGPRPIVYFEEWDDPMISFDYATGGYGDLVTTKEPLSALPQLPVVMALANILPFGML